MNDYWVIVADGAQARFMALERHADAPQRAALRLVESAQLANPEHTVSGRRDASKIEGGRDPDHSRAPSQVQQHLSGNGLLPAAH